MIKMHSNGTCSIPECPRWGRLFKSSGQPCHLAERTRRLKELKCHPYPGPITVVLVEPGQLQWVPLWGPLQYGRCLSSKIYFNRDFRFSRLCGCFYLSRGGSRLRGSIPHPGDRELKPRSPNSMTCSETDTGMCCLSPRARLGPAGETECELGLEELEVEG